MNIPSTLEELKADLETNLPQYTYALGNRPFYGKCIVAKDTKYFGADIFLKHGRIEVEASIPEMRTRLLIGSGALLMKWFNPKFSAPESSILEYLGSKYQPVKRRTR